MLPSIAILGAGPSGLMLGRLLELAEVDYIIFERDGSPPEARQGGCLDIHATSGQLALQEAGLLDLFKTHARYDAPTVVADQSGNVFMKFADESGQTDRPEIDRKTLRGLLLNSIPENKVRWRSRVEQVKRSAEGSISIHFDSGAVESGFRLVVGADGAWSKARSLVTTAVPQYSGLSYLTTTIKPTNPSYSVATNLVGQGNYMAIGCGKQIAAQRMSDGSYNVAIGLNLPERWAAETNSLADPSALRRWLLQDCFADWAEVNTNLIKYSEREFHVWPLYAMPVDSLCWEATPGVTLIGDAAHVTTPFEGEGVNCAMYDSFQLAQQIVQLGVGDLDRAVAKYEKLMFPRAIDLITRSKENGKLLFAPDAPRGFAQEFEHALI